MISMNGKLCFVGLASFLCSCISNDSNSVSLDSAPFKVSTNFNAHGTKFYMVTIPLEDSGGIINDFDESIFCVIQVSSNSRNEKITIVGDGITRTLKNSRLSFRWELISGSTDKVNKTFSAQMFIHATNDDTGSDNPFNIHAIVNVYGAFDADSRELKYKVIKNFGPRIHPNQAYYNPPWYQSALRIKISDN